MKKILSFIVVLFAMVAGSHAASTGVKSELQANLEKIQAKNTGLNNSFKIARSNFFIKKQHSVPAVTICRFTGITLEFVTDIDGSGHMEICANYLCEVFTCVPGNETIFIYF